MYTTSFSDCHGATIVMSNCTIVTSEWHLYSNNSIIWCQNSRTMTRLNRKYTWLHCIQQQMLFKVLRITPHEWQHWTGSIHDYPVFSSKCYSRYWKLCHMTFVIVCSNILYTIKKTEELRDLGGDRLLYQGFEETVLSSGDCQELKECRS